MTHHNPNLPIYSRHGLLERLLSSNLREVTSSSQAELSRLAEESSLPTHASEQCVSARRYLATVLAALIHGEDRDEVASLDWKPLKQLNDIMPLHPLIYEIAQGSFCQKQPPAIQGSGWGRVPSQQASHSVQRPSKTVFAICLCRSR